MLLQALVRVRHLARVTALLTLALAAFFLTQPFSPQQRSSAAGATLGLPGAVCEGNSAAVTFAWTPLSSGVQQQWLDISLHDNGWEPGTFIGAGPLAPGVSTYTWRGIASGLPHVWRINSLTAAGWVVSETGTFVPCGGPALLYGPLACAGANAVVDFRWAPMSAPGGFQWLDLGFDPNFAPGSFVGRGPLAPNANGLRWEGIQANVIYFFRVNALGIDGHWHTSQTGSFSAPCSGAAGLSYNPDIYGSNDILYSARLGIHAPVNVRDVGPDGQMGDPLGPTDVVRYNFPLFPGMGGYPGYGGTTIIAGHVDYRSYGLAIFHPLRNVQKGDRIEYRRGDGVTIVYEVDWFADLPPDYDWNSLAASSNPETLVLITCNGEFNSARREYSHRRVVHAVRVN